MSWDQYSQTPASNDLSGYFQTGMAPSKVKNAGWGIMADLASRFNALTTGGGTANAQLLTQTRPFSSLTTGLEVLYLPLNANTGATTFAPDGLTAKNVFAYGAALLGGELQTNVPAWLKYDGTQWNLLNPNDATGSFTITLTGMTGATTGTVNWRIVKGKTAYIYVSSLISGTSNTTAMTGTGVPAALSPVTGKFILVRIRDNGTPAYGHMETGTSTTWTFGATAAVSTSNFTGSGTKGLEFFEFSYTLD